MLSDTHTYWTMMQFRCILILYVQGDSFYRGEKDRSQRQTRWEMRHNVQQYCVTYYFLVFTCTKARDIKMSEYSMNRDGHIWFPIELETWINQKRTKEQSIYPPSYPLLLGTQLCLLEFKMFVTLRVPVK